MTANILTTNQTVLKANTKQALFLQGIMLAAALGLPALCHILGLSGGALLPMHWPILLCALVYGYRPAITLALAAVAISFALSGMPPVYLLPLMAGELAIYAFVAGFCREKLHLNYFVSLLLALVAGKLVYIALGYLVLPAFSAVVLASGAFAVLGQLILIPVLAKKWTSKLQ
ncbi:MAG: hypothetical protein LBM71_00330 [Elusimicrobiota bacterium]|jgi:hypothetical protein|nr:hypothetical protein [Elusimicrobiota bacterium]